MFSFSMDKSVPLDVTPGELAQQNIGESRDLVERLRATDQYRADERYYRAENASPASLQEAISYVQGIFFHPPQRVWFGDEVHEVTDDDLAGTKKPTS